MPKAKIFNMDKFSKKNYPNLKEKRTNNFGSIMKPVTNLVAFKRHTDPQHKIGIVYEAIAA